MEENRNTSENANESTSAGGASGSTNEGAAAELAAKGKELVSKTTEKLNANPKVCMWTALGASIVLILSTLLPYMSAMGESINLLSGDGDGLGDGIFFLILGIVCIVFILWKRMPIVVMVCGIITFLLTLYEMSQFSKVLKELSFFSSLVSKGIGYYLLILSSLVLLVASCLDFWMSKKKS